MIGLLGGTFGAPIGDVLGVAGRTVANKVGQGVNRVTNPISLSQYGIERPAANKLVQKLAQDNPDAVVQNFTRLGPLATFADAGPNMEALAGGIAAKGGEGLNQLTSILEGRRGATTARLQSDLNTILGPAEDPQLVTNALRGQRKLEHEVYPEIHRNAPPVDASSVADAIDAHLKDAVGPEKSIMQTIRKELVETPEKTAADGTVTPETYTTSSQKVHNIRKWLDGMINYGDAGLGVTPGAVSAQQGALKDVRGALDSVLKDQVPGMREADAASSALADRIDAVKEGYKEVFNTGDSAQWPSTYAAEFGALTPEEQQAIRQGVRGRLEKDTGVKANDLTALKTALQIDHGGEGGWNAQKLGTVWGDQAKNDLLAAVNREKAFEATNANVLKNSKTSAREGAKADLKEGSPIADRDWRAANPLGLALGFAKNQVVNPIANILLGQDRGAYEAQLARALTAQGAERDALYSGLLARHAQNQIVSSRAAPVGNAVRYGTNLLLRGAGATERPELPAWLSGQ
jgi:hypothetical protein